MRQDENGQQLSRIELQVVSYISMPDKAIAHKMHRSVHTIARHMQNIRAKLQMDSKVSIAI